MGSHCAEFWLCFGIGVVAVLHPKAAEKEVAKIVLLSGNFEVAIHFKESHLTRASKISWIDGCDPCFSPRGA